MKFTWKMIVAMSLLLALALSINGALIIGESFSSQLNAAFAESQKELRLLTLTLQTLTDSRNAMTFQPQTEDVLLATLRQDVLQQNYDFRLLTEDGSLFYQSQGGNISALDYDEAAQCGAQCETRLLRADSAAFVLSRQRVEIFETCYIIECCVDVSAVFSAGENNLRFTRQVLLGMLAVCVAVTAGFALVLTRPLRRISRAARQLSDGHYDRRVTVRTKDELGQLARDFNSMADSLERKIAELNDAVERQKEFTASFAHELKTPLTSVIGYADTLRSRQLRPEQQTEAADYIFREGRRLEAMSFALLDLFALEREQPKLRPCSLSRLVQEAADSAAYLCAQKNISLEIRVAEHTCQASPELLKTLLFNLLDNARKASQAGSTVRICGELAEDGYRLSVIDRGCGIPAESLARITEPFYMVDKSRARADGGAGLGLALCQRIAQVHGLHLIFSSEVRKGTSVTLLFGGGAK